MAKAKKNTTANTKGTTLTSVQYTRACMNRLLAILLNDISKDHVNQPDVLQKIFYDYCSQWEEPYKFGDSETSHLKSGSRRIGDDIMLFYKKRSREFSNTFRGLVYSALKDPVEVTGQFLNVISLSYDPHNSKTLYSYRKKALAREVETFTPQERSDFMADMLYFFMYHPNYSLKVGEASPPPDFILGSKIGSTCPFFCGRDDSTMMTYKLLAENGYAFITGHSGYGKSELSRGVAVKYSQRYPAYYKHTFIVPFHKSFRDTIIHIPCKCDAEIQKRYNARREQLFTSLGDHPDLASTLQNELKILQDQYHDELYDAHNRLISSLTPNDLMVIDGANLPSNQDPLLAHVLAYPCHVLITSQYNYSDYAHLELTGIQDPKALKELVASYWKDARTNSDKTKEMISLLHSHTLMIILCAKLLDMGSLLIDELLGMLRIYKAGLSAEDKIKIRKDGKNISDTFHGFIRMLFPFFQLAQEEQYILTNLALFPAEGIRLADFKEWLDLKDPGFRKRCAAAIYNLVEKGLIQNRNGILSMHALIQEVVVAEEEVTPTVQRCRSLLSFLHAVCKEHCETVEHPENVFRVLMNTVTLAKKDDVDFYASLIKDALFASVFQGYQEGVQFFSEELNRLLSCPQVPLDSLHTAMKNYLNACKAKTTAEARIYYHAIMVRFYAQPVESVLSPQFLPSFRLLVKMGIATFNGFKHEIGPERTEKLIQMFKDESYYLFCTLDGWKEYTRILAQILDKLLLAAHAVICGIPSGITIGEIVRIVDPDPI